MKTIREKAADMLQQCPTVVLASVDPKGYPRPVPMSRIASEGLSPVWMATGKDSLKTKDFAANPKAGLCFGTGGESVALTGTVTVVTDEAAKQAMWQEWFIEHFTEGPADPNYVLLRFEGRGATFWIDSEFVHTDL